MKMGPEEAASELCRKMGLLYTDPAQRYNNQKEQMGYSERKQQHSKNRPSQCIKEVRRSTRISVFPISGANVGTFIGCP